MEKRYYHESEIFQHKWITGDTHAWSGEREKFLRVFRILNEKKKKNLTLYETQDWMNQYCRRKQKCVLSESDNIRNIKMMTKGKKYHAEGYRLCLVLLWASSQTRLKIGWLNCWIESCIVKTSCKWTPQCHLLVIFSLHHTSLIC